MGQVVRAVLYGCPVPDGVYLRDDPNGDGLLDKWETEAMPKFDDVGFDGWWKALSLTVPRCDEGNLFGFYVAGVREDCNDDGERMTGVVDLDALAATDRAKRAVERWDRFATWAASQGIVLPKARLYLTETEVA